MGRLRFRSIALIVGCLYCAVFLAACGGDYGPIGDVDAQVSLRENAQWSAHVVVSFTPQELATVPGGEDAIKQEMENELAPLTKAGAEASLSRAEQGGHIVYTFTASGTGVEKLNQVAFNSKAFIHSPGGNTVLYFSYTPTFPSRSFKLSLTSGQILSSNADVTQGTTIIWNNIPTTIEGGQGKTAEAIINLVAPTPTPAPTAFLVATPTPIPTQGSSLSGSRLLTVVALSIAIIAVVLWWLSQNTDTFRR